MFDMGFEPQISKIIQNTRPDRQTVLFSATFPTNIEGLARRALTKPLEIIVGGKTKAAAEIEQIVEIRTDEEKWRRLLQLLGVWSEKGQILVFVDTQHHCDSLFADLLKVGYSPLSLHGGKDQYDRDQVGDLLHAILWRKAFVPSLPRKLDTDDCLVCVCVFPLLSLDFRRCSTSRTGCGT
jgi:ATP-dependent RNA helicase DDX46/PRP5